MFDRTTVKEKGIDVQVALCQLQSRNAALAGENTRLKAQVGAFADKLVKYEFDSYNLKRRLRAALRANRIAKLFAGGAGAIGFIAVIAAAVLSDAEAIGLGGITAIVVPALALVLGAAYVLDFNFRKDDEE